MIEKIVQEAKTTINKPIHLILGGFHLLPAKDDQIKAIAAFLHDDAKVDYIVPAHCTGEPAFVIFKEAFGDKDVYAGLGATVVAGREVRAERCLFSAEVPNGPFRTCPVTTEAVALPLHSHLVAPDKPTVVAQTASNIPVRSAK